MDKLIENYKKELIEDEACGYGYPTGLKNRIINEIESNNFAIPVEKVQQMIESVREENVDTEDSGLHLQRVIVSESDIDAMFPYEDIETARPTRPEQRIRAYNSRQADRREGAKRLLEKLHSR